MELFFGLVIAPTLYSIILILIFIEETFQYHDFRKGPPDVILQRTAFNSFQMSYLFITTGVFFPRPVGPNEVHYRDPYGDTHGNYGHLCVRIVLKFLCVVRECLV